MPNFVKFGQSIAVWYRDFCDFQDVAAAILDFQKVEILSDCLL